LALGRQFFLWASENKWLEKQLTERAFTRRAVQRFLPGESLEDAVGASEVLRERGIKSILTQLGENVSEGHDADAVAEHYLSVLDLINERQLDADVSLKPTQFGLDMGLDEAQSRIERIVRRAGSLRRLVAIDMESSAYVSTTIELYKRLRSEHSNVALCLQAYLHRTASDVVSLLPLSPTIRLVKGAYKEPGNIVFTKKRDVDANFLRLAGTLLQEVKQGNARVFFGTHDPRMISGVSERAKKLGLKKNSFEIQMLYGIQGETQARLASKGYVVRSLISYGESWYPWYMRRLAERPANVFFLAKNLFKR
jgi:proline dehydrogenase